ncbi:MAG: glycosyltransferase family 2 protein [Pigmentiphaga sp.]|uniref:Glycosyltransferase family 2 protein n=1 Tax=Pigmentiphaga daeguensis TaxID=414049 RepID=A0ABN1BVE4_9BURK
MDLSICICTFRRPELLGHLLAALGRQSFDGVRAEIVVVDNDPAASGLPVARKWSACLPLPIQTVHVPTPNISMARNAAVHAATGRFILFIDDDESPEPDWPLHMLRTQAAHKADIVVGPVCPRYHEQAPAWIVAGGFFAPRAHATGDSLRPDQGYSGNTLIRREMALKLPGPFDPAFGATGGEDAMFLWDMHGLSARMVWCAEAAVSEHVPTARTNLAWILRRAYWGGQTLVRARANRLPPARKAALFAYLGLRATTQLLLAGAFALCLLPVSRLKAIRWLNTASAQAGKLSAIVGYHNREYAAS